jgi:transposase InsO family protein
VLTDNGSEYRAGAFTATLAQLAVEQRRIRAGRPQTNGHVERLQQTILEECWRPSHARSLVPKLTALERDLKQYLGNFRFAFGKTFMNTIVTRMDANDEIFKRVLDDQDFRTLLADHYVKKVYDQLREAA